MSPETQHMLQILRTAIRVLGYTQQDIEKKLGVSQGYLSRLFRGIIQLQFDHVVAIARAVEMEPEEIFQLAYPQPRNPPTLGAQRLREMFHPPSQATPPAADQAPATVPAPQAGLGAVLEQELERLVERKFERFFAELAKSAGRRE
jgi:transcriptional regulator with XRE-family HTH domain